MSLVSQQVSSSCFLFWLKDQCFQLLNYYSFGKLRFIKTFVMLFCWSPLFPISRKVGKFDVSKTKYQNSHNYENKFKPEHRNGRNNVTMTTGAINIMRVMSGGSWTCPQTKKYVSWTFRKTFSGINWYPLHQDVSAQPSTQLFSL